MTKGVSNFSDRLAKYAELNDLSIADIARGIGMTHSAVSHYFSGKNSPKVPVLVQLADLLCVPVQDLINPASEPFGTPEKVDLSGTDFVRIPIRELVGEGDPRSVPRLKDTDAHLAFHTAWLKAQGVDPLEASLIRMNDDQMKPTISAGDVVLIDHRRRSFIGKASVFACTYGGGLTIKRIELSSDGQVYFLHSDDPSVPTQHIIAKHKDALTIIGRVIWSSKIWQQDDY